MGRSRAARADAVNLVRSRPSLSLNVRRRSEMERSRAASCVRDMMVVTGKQHQTTSFDKARWTAQNNGRTGTNEDRNNLDDSPANVGWNRDLIARFTPGRVPCSTCGDLGWRDRERPSWTRRVTGATESAAGNVIQYSDVIHDTFPAIAGDSMST